jgi:hypothetical protein
MTKPSLIARCTLSEQCLPDAPYRAMLCKLHKDMLDEIDRLKAVQPAVPDAMTSADIQEHIEYVAGWNDCRQAMLEMMKARIKS